MSQQVLYNPKIFYSPHLFQKEWLFAVTCGVQNPLVTEIMEFCVQNLLGHLFLADKKKLWYLPNRKVAEGSRTRYTSSPSFLQFVGKAEGFDGGRNKDLEQNFFFGCPPALNDTTRISTSIIGTHFLDEQSTVLKDDLSLICGQLFAWKYVNTLLTNE